MTYLAKVHYFDNEKLIAICDENIIGKTFVHNGVELHIQPRFYGDLVYTEEEILIELKNATSINVIGESICKLLIEHEFVHPDTIMWINNGDTKVGHVIVVK